MLDVGAGTGRVALDLARAGHEVDRARPRRRAARGAAPSAAARPAGRDAWSPTPPASTPARRVRARRRADADDPAARRTPPRARGFLALRARAHLAPGGLVALAIADELETFDGLRELPLPDIARGATAGGYVSPADRGAPRRGRGTRIERLRADASRPAASAPPSADVDRARPRHAPTSSSAEGAAAGLEPLPRRATSTPTDDHVGSDGGGAAWLTRTLRVCALYPDLMNIYADRGNLLLLERRCEWRGIGFELRRRPGSASALDPDAHDLFYIGGGQDRDQALCARDLVETKRDALHAAAGARRRRARRLRRLPAARPRLRAGRRDAPGRRPRRPETVREDGPRLIGNVAIELEPTAHGAGRLREPRRPHAARARARSRSAACCAATATTARSGFEGVRGGRRHGHRDLSPRSAAAQERLVRRLADRHGAGHRAVASWRRSTTRWRTPPTPRRAAPPVCESSAGDWVGSRAPCRPGDSSLTTANTAQTEGPSASRQRRVAGVPRGDQALPGHRRAGRRRPDPRGPGGRDLRARRAVRLRQDDRDADGQPHDRHHRRRHPRRRPQRRASATRPSCGARSAT